MLFPIFILIAATLFYHMYWKRRKLPPGPLPLPVIGNLHTIGRHEPGYTAFEMWRKQYGSVYTYWIGALPAVIVADYKTLKETFIKDGESYQDKYNFEEMTEMFRGGEFGVVETNGYLWREHRRFILHQLREFGLGKNAMEQRVMLEVHELTKTLLNSKSELVAVQEILDQAVGSVINQLLFGYRFDETNLSEFLKMKALLCEMMHTSAQPDSLLVVNYPILSYLPFFSRVFKRIMNYRDQLFAFFDAQIKDHEDLIDYSNEDATDFVYAYLKEKHKRENENDYGSFSQMQLRNLCLDLWLAGMETTSNTLAWAIVYVLNNPDVQAKLHEEFDRVIGSSREIVMSDKPNLPYTSSVINEVQRMANLLPMNLIHKTTTDVEINGYKIEKNTAIIPQISNVLYDAEIFPEPYRFNPDRFMSSDGKVKKVEEHIPFSIGKRQCLGESLARMELFLFTANIFNRFKLTCDEMPSTKKLFGVTVQPMKFKCRASPRY